MTRSSFPLRRGFNSMGFTLIELLASMAILSVLIMVLVSMVNSTSSIWRYTTAKTEQFREAREGFESMTKKLSQATLNTYWDYDNPAKPTKYVRKADLRYYSGNGFATGSTTGDPSLPSPPIRPTHAVFFCAPLGFVDNTYDATASKSDPYRGLDYLLNTWGFYIQCGPDSGLKPSFVKTKDRIRFRLMESMAPSQWLNMSAMADPNNARYKTRDWIYDSNGGYNFNSKNSHVLAENIVALVILPKPSKADIDNWNSSSSASKYDEYSLVGPSGSTYSSFEGDTSAQTTQKRDAHLNPINQLPPVVQVSVVAIDEASATRMSLDDNINLLNKLKGLFTKSSKYHTDLYGDPANPSQAETSDSLTEYLTRKHINYRVFTSDVGIRGAKWSTEQTN